MLLCGADSTLNFSRIHPHHKSVYNSGNGEQAMQLTLPADLESLINKRLSTGAYADAEDVVRHALEFQDAEEGLAQEEILTDEERSAISAHIEEGYQQALRGEFITPEQAKRDLQFMQQKWLASRG